MEGTAVHTAEIDSPRVAEKLKMKTAGTTMSVSVKEVGMRGWDLEVQQAPEGDRLIDFISDQGQQILISHLFLFVSYILHSWTTLAPKRAHSGEGLRSRTQS